MPKKETKKWTKKFTFRASIELNSEYIKINEKPEFDRLTSKGKYWFNKKLVEYKELQEKVKKIINDELLEEVKIFLKGEQIEAEEIEIKKVEEGCITIIFTISLSGFIGQLISNFIIGLITTAAIELLKRKLIHDYGNYFIVSVYPPTFSTSTCNCNNNRNTFFYFLSFLVFCLALIALIALIAVK